MSTLFALQAGAYLASGALLGALYFYTLYRTVLLLPRAPWYRVVPLVLLRVGAAVIVLAAVAARGALPLALALTGFLGARLAIQWSLGSQSRWNRRSLPR